MKTILLTLGLIFSSSAFCTDYFDQLVAFNFNWKQYKDRVPNQEAQTFQNDREYIQSHLKSVLKILHSNPTDHLNAEQLASRTQLIALLSEYREQGLFPMNYNRSERIPVFIDEHNTHCAVGYLLQQTGFDHVARRISEGDNYVWVKDITDPALPIWQEASGFTLDELKLIQGAYDSYVFEAYLLPNRIEIPQKPAVVARNFNGNEMDLASVSNTQNVWCYGQGTDTLLHGLWIQNYDAKTPWIEGYYERGKRTGSWKEYYKGTDKLCRTEHWRNDLLNGVRTRYDLQGKIIEEIVFKDGKAVLKTNYEDGSGLKYIRVPLDSNTVRTEVFTLSGTLLAKGEEKIYNPSGLQWFQNIELTALNTMAISVDRMPQGGGVFEGQNDYGRNISLFQEPQLVEYKKIGNWTYYNQYTPESFAQKPQTTLDFLRRDFPVYSYEIGATIRFMENEAFHQSFDSVSIAYEENVAHRYAGFAGPNAVRIGMEYYEPGLYRSQGQIFELGSIRPAREYYYDYHQPRFQLEMSTPLKSIGFLNESDARMGDWIWYDQYGSVFKVEKYMRPFKPEEEMKLRSNK